MLKDKLRVPLRVPRRALLVLLSAAAITALVAVQFGEYFHWITLQQRFRGPKYNALIEQQLIDKRSDPDSISDTELDRELAKKYNEACVKLGSGHMEPTLPAPTRCFSRKEVQDILTNIALMASAVFKKHNITHFLDSGTLLGAVRHKGLIPFDQDVDIGIDEAGYEKIKATPILFPKEYVLHVFNSSVHPKGSRYIQLPVRLVHRESTLYSDVFVYIDSVNDNGEQMTGPMTSGAFINCRKCPKVGKSEKTFNVPYDWIYPLQPCRFAGFDLNCPNQPEKYLLHMFGKGYMTPEVFPY